MDKEEKKDDEALVGAFHSEGHESYDHCKVNTMRPGFYLKENQGEFHHWFRQYPESIFDTMTICHYSRLQDEMDSARLEAYSLLEPCEVLTEEEKFKGGLTPWVDEVGEMEIGMVHVDGTQEEEAIIEVEKLEEPLHFKTTSTGILVGHDVKDYLKVPPDWYRNTEEQTHVTERDWKYVHVTLESGKVRQMKMESKLRDEEIREYSELIDEFSNTFAWSYDELKGITREMVEHRIPLIPRAKPVRQKESRRNPQLQLLIKEELERLLQAGFIKLVEITDWVLPMVIVKKKNGKLRVCVDYRKLHASTQNDHFPLPFITLLLDEVGGHARYTFMDGYAGHNQIAIALCDVHKTTFTTPWDTFVWVVMSFRLCNAPATFQRLVMYIFTDLLFKSMTVYIDDFSTQSTNDNHVESVRLALVRCRNMRLALNPDKTFLGVQRGVLLGYVVSEKMREPDPYKIAVIDGLATPTNAKGITKLLGHVGWYRELIPDFAKIAVAITQLLKKDCRLCGRKIARGLLRN